MCCEYVAQLVRVERLENGNAGVAVHLQRVSTSTPEGHRAQVVVVEDACTG
jgi:hypothetical protein